MPGADRQPQGGRSLFLSITQQDRIEALWEQWAYLLDGWDVRRSYYPGEFIDGAGEASGDALASAVSDWRYLHGSVAFNTELAEQTDDEELENTIVHEMCHFLVNEMRTPEMDIDHEERVCSTLARALTLTKRRSICYTEYTDEHN